MAMSCSVPLESVTLYLNPMNGALAVCVPFWNFRAPSPVPSTILFELSLAEMFAMLFVNARL